jgi:3-methyladenine DNA glycosylase AlkD
MPANSPRVTQILNELKAQGNGGYKRIMVTHGAKEPIYGVKIEYLKKIQKRVGQDYQLAKDLFDSGVHEAMYLAGLITDDKKMTKSDLNAWAKNAASPMIADYTVPWVAAESGHGWPLGLKWIDSKDERIASTGWATLSSCVAITDDEQLDLSQIKKLLERVVKEISRQSDRVKYTMNNFVIAVGTYVVPLSEFSLGVGKKIGPLQIDMGGTSCKVPNSSEYIAKAKKAGRLGKKRKSAKC